MSERMAVAAAIPHARLRQFGQKARETFMLMVGVPDYDAYLRHWAAKHPDQTPMTREQFFINRQESRYGAGASRCC